MIQKLVFMFVSYPLGALGDKFGFKPIFVSGLLVFSVVYSIFRNGFNSSIVLLLVFAVYGVFGAVGEGT